ncbi:MAG TPA: TonB-dependent receptor, partial [Anseongella sp.]
MKHALLLLLVIVPLSAFPQVPGTGERFTLSGYLKDAATGEAVSGATVTAATTGVRKGNDTSEHTSEHGTSSNNYGFYSLTLPAGTYALHFSGLGYRPVNQEVILNADQRLDLELHADTGMLEQVVVSSQKADEHVRSVAMSVNKLDAGQIREIPALLGEADVIRSIQLLPGVTTVGEGAAGVNIRGGAADQILVLLDEAPVYNTSHLFGFFSIFNPDAVREV